MDEDNPNPYAPPRTEAFSEIPPPSMETLEQLGPIRFSGAVTERDLREFLSVDGNVGGEQLFMIATTLALILLAVSVLSGPMMAIGIGGMGLLAIVVIVSTLPYRRLVFKSLNPHWNKTTRGGWLDTDGIFLMRDDVSAFFRWDWYDKVVVSDQVVAFVPATQTAQPLMITKSMLSQLEDWDRVLQVAQAIGIATDTNSIDQRRRSQNLRILRESNRRWTLQVPDTAIVFSGALTARDFARIPDRFRRRERPLRANMVIAGLVVFGGVALAGISQLIFWQITILPVLVLAYVVIGVFFVRLRRRGDVGDDTVFYLNAFATEYSIFSDFAITHTIVPWPALQLATRDEDLVVFRRRDWVQFIVARRDMFKDEPEWRRFNQLVDRIVKPV